MFWLFLLAVFGGLGYYMYNLNKQEEIEGSDYGDTPLPEGQPEGQIRRMKIDGKWRTVNTSSTLVEGAEGKQDIVLEFIKRNLKVIAVPSIKVEERHVVYSEVVADLFAGGRKMLVIQNKKIRGYCLFVHIYDYGKQLHVSWYLMLRENWLSRLLRYTELHWGVTIALFPVVILAKIFYTASRTTIPELMNMFDTEELTAYCTTVHHAVQGAVNDVASDLELNSAKISWQTRGFLTIV